MSEPEQPEILSLEEVRAVASGIHAQPGTWNWREVASLCLTVEHWHREADEQRERAEFLGTQHSDFKARIEHLTGERSRLSALVARMRSSRLSLGGHKSSNHRGCNSR